MGQLTKEQLALYLGQEAEINLYGKQRPNLIITGQTLCDLEIHQRDYPEKEFTIKPILRPLSDITEQEAKMVLKHSGWDHLEDEFTEWDAEFGMYKQTIESDIEVYEETIKIYIGRPAVWFYLLSRGFDLFNWIEQGLAISRPASGIEATPNASEV